MGICLIIKSGGGIDTSSATATADKILSGYTIYSNDNKVTGSMTNVGTQTASGLNAGGSTTVKAGWHNGTGTVTTNTLSSQTQCDIPNQWWCLTGYSYWANGSKYDGAMVNRGAKTWTIGANGSQTIEDGWHNGNGTVSQSISVDNGEWGPTPTTTNQQLCWQGWYYSKNRWCWGSGNLTSGNIRSGVSIFGVSGSWSGWVDSTIGWNAIGASTAIRNLGEYTINGTKYTPSNLPFNMELWQNEWSKLIGQGFNYICWDCTANAYKDSKWSYSTDLRCSFWLKSSVEQDLSMMGIWWDVARQRWIDTLNMASQFDKDLPIKGLGGFNVNGYGSDISTSGKYDIKTPGNHVLSKGKNWFKLMVRFYPHGSSDDDGFSMGKVNVKSINVWFSKS